MLKPAFLITVVLLMYVPRAQAFTVLTITIPIISLMAHQWHLLLLRVLPPLSNHNFPPTLLYRLVKSCVLHAIIFTVFPGMLFTKTSWEEEELIYIMR